MKVFANKVIFSGGSKYTPLVVNKCTNRITIDRRGGLRPIFPRNVTLIQESFDVKPLFMASMGF